MSHSSVTATGGNRRQDAEKLKMKKKKKKRIIKRKTWREVCNGVLDVVVAGCVRVYDDDSAKIESDIQDFAAKSLHCTTKSVELNLLWI